jgi:Cdc6-like AAA superfamily ATPase
MHPRVQSRLGSHRCPFRAYGIPEAADILKAKLKLASPNFDIFKPDCIQFVAKKTASMSGDIRKAFIICRTAAELVLEDIESGKIKDERPQVTMSYLFAVSKDTFNSPQSNRMNTLAAFEVLVIVALASLTKSTGREQGGFDVDEIVTKMEAMVNALGDNQYIPPPSLTETLQLLAQLGTAHLISLQTPRNASITRAGTGGPWPLSKLLVDETVVWVALKDTPHNPLVKRYLKR